MKTRIPKTALLFPELSPGSGNPWRTTPVKQVHCGDKTAELTTLEVCAGGGGQAIGLEQAGIEHAGLVELDKHACATLRVNRPNWNVIQHDLNSFNGSLFKGVDIISGGLPCPPFSVAGKQLGKHDERNLFPAMIRLVDEILPRAVMIENVRGILDAVFEDYRGYVGKELTKLGYEPGWKLMNATDFAVPQLRPRVVFVAVRRNLSEHFAWPQAFDVPVKTVGETLHDLMAANGWKGAREWARRADEIAPTAVVGSISTVALISDRHGHAGRGLAVRATQRRVRGRTYGSQTISVSGLSRIDA